jgi:hypothetical protein
MTGRQDAIEGRTGVWSLTRYAGHSVVGDRGYSRAVIPMASQLEGATKGPFP